MKIYFECEKEEMHSNIGIAKALSETLKPDDLREIALYLAVFVTTRKTEEGGET